MGAEYPAQIFARQFDRLNMRAEILEPPGGPSDGGGDLRIDFSMGRCGPQSDARSFEDSLRPCERRQLTDALVPVVDIPPGHDVEHRGGIFR